MKSRLLLRTSCCCSRRKWRQSLVVGILILAFGLAGATAARHLAVCLPAVIVNKKKPASVERPEMKYPQEIPKAGKVEAQNSRNINQRKAIACGVQLDLTSSSPVKSSTKGLQGKRAGGTGALVSKSTVDDK